jgi:hypothetical protein
VRKVFAILSVVAPLMAACGKVEEPLIPELKGRWEVLSNFAKTQPERVRVAGPAQPDATAKDYCRVMYVTFSKHAITMHMMGIPLSLFHIADMRREGPRLTLTVADSAKSASHGRLVLLLRDGGVRFDDLFDERDRSVKYERLPDDHASRKHGATTVGEATQLFLDLKPCTA